MIYVDLFLTFFKIGAFTFGGGYAMLPLIQQEVARNGWMTQEELLDFVAISESTPGPFAVNASTFVGCQMAGVLGGICATLGVVLPSFIIILLIAKAYERFAGSKLVKNAMVGLKGAVVGLIGVAVLTTLRTIFPLQELVHANETTIAGVCLFGVVLFFLNKKVNPILLILCSAVAGIILHQII